MTRWPSTRITLLARLGSDDGPAAWADFVAVYGPAVYGYARRRGLQDADAADATQNVFLSVARAIPGFRLDPARGTFRGWLFTAVEREVARALRRLGRSPVPTDPADLARPDPRAADPAALWDEAVRRQRFAVALDRARSLFSDTTVRAFELTAVDRLSGDEAAARLGISRAAVYLARARVLARLRELVRETDVE